MKKIITLLLALLMMFALCGCGVEEKPSNEILAREAVEDWIRFYYPYLEEGIQSAGARAESATDKGNGKYEVKGYVFIKDDYGDNYEAKFEAIISIAGDETELNELNVGTFHQN